MSNPADPAAFPAARVTAAGADWLASASCFPRSVHALWALRPAAPSVLPCGTAFDVVSTAPVAGRRVLDRLWTSGPGSGPVAVHQGRMLLFCAPGTADRLPALLDWEEWDGRRRNPPAGRACGHGGGPAVLCHGRGDAVTVPALRPEADSPASSRWLVAPDLRHPWLPGADVLLWACVRRNRGARAFRTSHTSRASHAGRGGEGGGGGDGISIFTPPDRDAKVYDVSRRR